MSCITHSNHEQGWAWRELAVAWLGFVWAVIRVGKQSVGFLLCAQDAAQVLLCRQHLHERS